MKTTLIIATIAVIAWTAGALTSSIKRAPNTRDANTDSAVAAASLLSEANSIAANAEKEAEHLRSMAVDYDKRADELELTTRGKPFDVQVTCAAQIGSYRGAAAGFREAAQEREEMARLAKSAIQSSPASSKN